MLLPIDAAGRVLEVLLLLDRHCGKAKLYFTLVFMATHSFTLLLYMGLMCSLALAGNVLLPIDAAGRVLEVLLLLDRHWEKAKLYFTLVFMAPQARQVLEYAKTQLTWMSDAVLQAFERSRDNPFALRYTLCLTVPCMLTPILA